MWIGRTIDATYRVDRELGHGGFGVVYAGEDVMLHLNVAIKALLPDRCGPRELESFLAEARNLAKLDHDNVVRIHRLGVHEGQHYIVMELLEGETLAEVIRSGRMIVRERLAVMQQVAKGLAAMHALDILHRDLSPRNVIRCTNGRVKIFDLGLSRDLNASRTESAHVVRGTLEYASPEQFTGRSLTVRSEVYSFGAILYEMLCGESPSYAEHMTGLMYNVTNRDPARIESRVPDCNPRLAELVHACLAKAPESRPASMSDIEQELGALLGEGGLERQVPASGSTHVRRSTNASNPYLHRVMIKHPSDFYGRRSEVRRIFSRLNASQPGSISIVGDRRIGKSSLLNHVYTREVREQQLSEPGRMVMAYLDLQVEKDMRLETFVDMLIGLVDLELHGRVKISDCPRSLDGVQEMVERLAKAGLRLAVLFDEFEVITANANFDLQFFSFLRYLANHYPVAYLTSSARNLQVLCHTREISDSPFFNIFSTMRIGAFPQAEAEELVREPSAAAGTPLEPWSTQLLALSGLFPCYIQMACSHALEHLADRPGSTPDFADIRRRFMDEASLHYQYLWDSLDEHERGALSRLAERRGISDALRHVVQELTDRAYVTAGEKPRLFSEPFDQFVLDAGRRDRPAGFLGKLFGRR
ncbi:MAG: serine/threonine-protein kinase [Candidatus Eisenbacteria bacterium]